MKLKAEKYCVIIGKVPYSISQCRIPQNSKGVEISSNNNCIKMQRRLVQLGLSIVNQGTVLCAFVADFLERGCDMENNLSSLS